MLVNIYKNQGKNYKPLIPFIFIVDDIKVLAHEYEKKVVSPVFILQFKF